MELSMKFCKLEERTVIEVFQDYFEKDCGSRAILFLCFFQQQSKILWEPPAFAFLKMLLLVATC